MTGGSIRLDFYAHTYRLGNHFTYGWHTESTNINNLAWNESGSTRRCFMCLPECQQSCLIRVRQSPRNIELNSYNHLTNFSGDMVEVYVCVFFFFRMVHALSLSLSHVAYSIRLHSIVVMLYYLTAVGKLYELIAKHDKAQL